ncbi:MAG: hypothetical protein CFK49_02955 [Armatimonadetes bacterium JP3_11]|jgi:hypothetical protein|nr:MAG: hypothetical protein CFK48_06055 [Armatimonadetes bacterium CP1_7O]OYT75487.1 MAG: hypothetical protein CFK49_02955 [Armatimonadetes bacterium JP3_11]RMH06123.1 MAG: hypothetical protein D6697_11265 [Armatimonadota bacterium]
MLKQVWQDSLPRDTLSFDVLAIPRQPTQLVTLDALRIRFCVWEGEQWREVRTHPHRMQRDLYVLRPAHEGKTLLYTDGAGWLWTEKELISEPPTRTVPIGRLVDGEGVARIICYDHQDQAPYYYVLEKPLLTDQFYLTPEHLLSDEIQSLVMQIPRSATQWNAFYINGYRFVALLRATEKSPARIYAVAQDRIARVEVRQGRPNPVQRVNLPSIGTPRREIPLCVRYGDPKDEKETRLIVMQATRDQVVLTAFSLST